MGVYTDGSRHCFSCGYHIFPKFYQPNRIESNVPKSVAYGSKAVLPADFTREVPAEGWKWLLQYGLPYSYWKKYTGYSPSHNRLVLTFGEPVKFSIGRALSEDKRKWRFWGDGHKYAEVLGKKDEGHENMTDLPRYAPMVLVS